MIEPIPTAVDTAIALGVVAVIVSIGVVRLGLHRRFFKWLGVGRGSE